MPIYVDISCTPTNRTRVETECNETIINIPKEECVQAFEKKCETEYKVIEKLSYIISKMDQQIWGQFIETYLQERALSLGVGAKNI